MTDRTYWHKQTAEQPLFPDVLWSRPETKRARGKLLIVGGHAQGFTAPAHAYQQAVTTGAGLTRVLLPRHVQRLLPSTPPEMEFVPSTPSGSFARQSLAELLDAANWADGVLLAGDFGRNSETAVVLEQFAAKYSGQLTMTGDSTDYFIDIPASIADREQTLLVPNFSQLQKLATSLRQPQAFTSGMDLLHLVDALHVLTTTHAITVVTQHLETIFVAVGGQVSSTKADRTKPAVTLAAPASVWWLQHSGKPFEAITSSIIS